MRFFKFKTIITFKGRDNLNSTNRIKEIRKENKLTLESFSKLIDIPRATLSRYENGVSEPKIEVWNKIAEYFNVSVPYLMGISNEKQSDSNQLLEEYNSFLKNNISLDSRIKNKLISFLEDYDSSNSSLHTGSLNDFLLIFSNLLQTLMESDNKNLNVRYNDALLLFSLSVDLIGNLYKYNDENSIKEVSSMFQLISSLYEDRYFNNSSGNSNMLFSSAKASTEYLSDKKKINDLLDKKFLEGFNRRYD